MFLEFLFWWYGAGWLDISRRIGGRVVAILHLFSVPILLATLFSPWKRIVSPPGRSIDQIFRGMIDNLVSRTVGFVVRLFVLITVFVMTTAATIVGFITVVSWPLLPIGVVYFAAMGVLK